MLRRLGGHRLGGGEGQLVGGPYHEVLKGELIALKHTPRPLGGSPYPVGAEGLIAEDAHGELHREDILQSGGNVP